MKKKYSQINLFLRSVIFFFYAVLTVIFYSFLCLIGFLFPLSFRHALLRFYLRAYLYTLKKICLIDYRIEGLENIPKNYVGIILCKHQSTWETFFLPTLFHNPAIIIKRELLWIPFFGWGLASGDPIAIDRKKQKSAMQQITEKGRQCLASGRSILIFPEGTRMPVGKVGKYRLGGGRLAALTGYPVLPIAHNAGYCWPKGKFIKKPGLIRVIIGPLIVTEGKSAEEIMREAKTWIENTVIAIGRA